MKLPSLLLSILLVSSLSVFAQSGEYLKGYIITIEQDTIEGYIKDDIRNVLSEGFSFKEGLSQTPTNKSSSDVIGFFMFPSFHFEAADFERDGISEKLFLRKLIDGVANLYQYNDRQQLEYLIVKKNGEVFQFAKNDSVIGDKVVRDNKYFGGIKYLFKDCPAMVRKKTIRYNEKSLSDIVSLYNNCIQPNSTTNLTAGRKLKINFGIMAGVRTYNTDISRLQSPQRAYEDNSAGLQLGGLISLSYFRKIAFQTGVLYTNYTASTEIPFSLGVVNVNHEINNIEIPFLVKYNFSAKKRSPYVFGGLRFGKNLNGTSKEEKTEAGVILPTKEFDLNFDRLFGYTGGLGLSIKFNEYLDAALELGYSRLGMNVGANEDFAIRGFDLSAKVFF